MTMKSQPIHPVKHTRKFSSPHQGEDMRILRSEEAASPELSQRWGQWAGKLCLTMGEFLNSVSQTKQTTGYLFSRTRERSHLHWPAFFVAFLLQKQEPLFKFTSVQGWKYKQTLLLSLVQSQAIKQALEISNLIRKKKNLLRQKSKTLIRVSSVKLSINDLSPK